MQKEAEGDLLTRFITRQHLPESYLASARRWFLPLADELRPALERKQLRVLGIVGSQGSGKSTLAALLQSLLGEQQKRRVVSLSLDDFYLTRAERQALAARVHPLLATRGVPGTHDLTLARDTISKLLTERGLTAVPRFDKACDDRRPEAEWERVESPVDLVILEGWCLAASAQSPADLEQPINRLEAEEDPQGEWRAFVNDHLARDYPELFAMIDRLIYLQAPSFDCVYHWRRRQERKIAADAGDQIMSDEALQRFVQHFERITRHSMQELPKTADVVFRLDEEQQVVERRGTLR